MEGRTNMRPVTRYFFMVFSIAVAAIMTSCGGSPSGLTPSISSDHSIATMPSSQVKGQSKRKHGKAKLIIRIPRKRKVVGRRMHPEYVSPSTKSMTVAVTGGSSQTFNLTAASPNCAPDPTSGYLTCREAMVVPSGQQTLSVILYDQQNAQGVKLASATTSVVVAATGFTNIPITLGGIVATATLLIGGSATASIPMGIPTSLPVSVEAYDADGNLIIAPGNYSSPITLTNADQSGITSFSAPAPGASRTHTKKGTLTRPLVHAGNLAPLDTTPVNAPGAGATLYYNGDPLTTTTITPSINGIPQYSGAATLSGTGAVITEYPVPTSGGDPSGITDGPDGALWFTEWGGNKIARITTAGIFSEYPVPTSASRPSGITVGPDGALWFTEAATSASKIGTITTSGVLTEFSIPTTHSAPLSVVAGPDGALWFAEPPKNKIGRITTSGTFTEYAVPTSGSYPQGITSGPDGALWFVENTGNNIGRITTSGTITEYPIPTSGSGTASIAAGPDGKLWFTETTGNNIGQIPTSATSGSGAQILEYPVPTSASGPLGITAAPDGALWFTESTGNNVGRITTNGAFTEYAIPTSAAFPVGITAGPNGTIWFAERSGNNIGSLP
jgi:virginiamycin B lyase